MSMLKKLYSIIILYSLRCAVAQYSSWFDPDKHMNIYLGKTNRYLVCVLNTWSLTLRSSYDGERIPRPHHLQHGLLCFRQSLPHERLLPRPDRAHPQVPHQNFSCSS